VILTDIVSKCYDWLDNKSLMSLYVSDCLLVDSNVCRQSLGKAAAATLYTESVCQSVVGSQSDVFRQSCLTVSGRIRIDHETVSELVAVLLNECNEFSEQCVHSLTTHTRKSDDPGILTQQ